MKVTFYEIATGTITRHGSSSDPIADLLEGEAFIEGDYRDSLFCIVDGEAAPLIVTEVPVTAWDITREKDRRLAAGFDFDFGDARGVHHIGTTSDDMVGWNDVTILAQAMINSGMNSGTIDILTDTGPTRITAHEWQAVLIAAGQFRQPIWAASFVLTAIDPLPMDYPDAKWWP